MSQLIAIDGGPDSNGDSTVTGVLTTDGGPNSDKRSIALSNNHKRVEPKQEQALLLSSLLVEDMKAVIA